MRSTRCAAADVDEIVVVTGHDADAVEAAVALPAHGRFVRNDAYRDGQATSLAAALHVWPTTARRP